MGRPFSVYTLCVILCVLYLLTTASCQNRERGKRNRNRNQNRNQHRERNTNGLGSGNLRQNRHKSHNRHASRTKFPPMTFPSYDGSSMDYERNYQQSIEPWMVPPGATKSPYASLPSLSSSSSFPSLLQGNNIDDNLDLDVYSANSHSNSRSRSRSRPKTKPRSNSRPKSGPGPRPRPNTRSRPPQNEHQNYNQYQNSYSQFTPPQNGNGHLNNENFDYLQYNRKNNKNKINYHGSTGNEDESSVSSFLYEEPNKVHPWQPTPAKLTYASHSAIASSFNDNSHANSNYNDNYNAHANSRPEKIKAQPQQEYHFKSQSDFHYQNPIQNHNQKTSYSQNQSPNQNRRPHQNQNHIKQQYKSFEYDETPYGQPYQKDEGNYMSPPSPKKQRPDASLSQYQWQDFDAIANPPQNQQQQQNYNDNFSRQETQNQNQNQQQNQNQRQQTQNQSKLQQPKINPHVFTPLYRIQQKMRQSEQKKPSDFTPNIMHMPNLIMAIPGHNERSLFSNDQYSSFSDSSSSASAVSPSSSSSSPSVSAPLIDPFRNYRPVFHYNANNYNNQPWKNSGKKKKTNNVVLNPNILMSMPKGPQVPEETPEEKLMKERQRQKSLHDEQVMWPVEPKRKPLISINLGPIMGELSRMNEMCSEYLSSQFPEMSKYPGEMSRGTLCTRKQKERRIFNVDGTR